MDKLKRRIAFTGWLIILAITIMLDAGRKASNRRAAKREEV